MCWLFHAVNVLSNPVYVEEAIVNWIILEVLIGRTNFPGLGKGNRTFDPLVLVLAAESKCAFFYLIGYLNTESINGIV